MIEFRVKMKKVLSLFCFKCNKVILLSLLILMEKSTSAASELDSIAKLEKISQEELSELKSALDKKKEDHHTVV